MSFISRRVRATSFMMSGFTVIAGIVLTFGILGIILFADMSSSYEHILSPEDSFSVNNIKHLENIFLRIGRVIQPIFRLVFSIILLLSLMLLIAHIKELHQEYIIKKLKLRLEGLVYNKNDYYYKEGNDLIFIYFKSRKESDLEYLQRVLRILKSKEDFINSGNIRTHSKEHKLYLKNLVRLDVIEKLETYLYSI